jgi:CRP-like cAMP-binding protein
VIFRNRLLSALSDADVAALTPAMVEVTWSPGELLYEVGGAVSAAHFPSSAGLSLVSVMGDGTCVECATVGFESAAGLLPALSGGCSSNRTFVQLAGSGISIPAEALRKRAAESPELVDLLLRFAQAVIAQEEQSVACNALHDPEQRLARWILQSHDRLNVRVLPLTQEYLAIMLGVQRTTVSAAASQLKDEGLIRYSRGQMEIVDRPRLERRSCECYEAVKRVHTRLLGSAGDEAQALGGAPDAHP